MPRKTNLETPFDFIAQHSVFRLDELEAAYLEMGRREASARRIVEFHIQQGRLLSIRRGVYVRTGWIDPWLLASKLADPIVISHDGALSFHGLTAVDRVTFMTTARTLPLQYNEVIYAPLKADQARMTSGTQQVKREGQDIFVTTVPVTLVDCLAALERGPPVVELMGIFKKSKKSVSASRMIQHALTFESPLLMARLAYFLTCARFELSVEDNQLINGNIPASPISFLRSARSKQDCSIRKWNIIVPPELYEFWPGNG